MTLLAPRSARRELLPVAAVLPVVPPGDAAAADAVDPVVDVVVDVASKRRSPVQVLFC
jgi:hypothetical protein